MRLSDLRGAVEDAGLKRGDPLVLVHEKDGELKVALAYYKEGTAWVGSPSVRNYDWLGLVALDGTVIDHSYPHDTEVSLRYAAVQDNGNPRYFGKWTPTEPQQKQIEEILRTAPTGPPEFPPAAAPAKQPEVML